LAGDIDRHYLFWYLENRFGIPKKLFDGYLLFERKKSWWLLKDSPLTMLAAQLKVSMAGLRVFHRIGEFVKPTTRFIQLFGHWATRAKLDINERQLISLSEGERLPVDLKIENGYVILSLKEQPLGLGLYIDGMVRSQIPRKELRLSTH
jgi:NOL1/NOP2/fmu family ribosome biogenesis protein